jgi:aldose sugar dehydrogenase
MNTKSIVSVVLFLCFSYSASSQMFTRSELPTVLITPWEITYGPDNFLWITEAGGKVSRVDPVSGNKTVIYTAPDYFAGSAAEQSTLCFQPNIGVGTLGLCLHPDFTNNATAFIYFLYSYNSGTTLLPVTKFKVERLSWNAATASVSANTTVISLLPTGYDHLGGRLMSVKQNNIPYLFVSCGDNGISEDNAPDCYSNQTLNPNNFVQDPNYKNGKIHRFNMDGSVPANNPKNGNSLYTRGHRNPQGLMYNYLKDVIYCIEHGDRSDDEINVLEAGKNYGWKNVRGYHSDNNYPGEAAFISNYQPDPLINNDGLKEPFYAWCAVPQSTTANGLDWCTVAPSDGIFYGSAGIPEWTNSLLVVTLKNGLQTDQELYQFKLNNNGDLVPSTPSDPNPKRFFAADQALNGRLRDIAVSPDGTKIYLVNNGGAAADKITVYTYDASAGVNNNNLLPSDPAVYPNPSHAEITIACSEKIEQIDFVNMMGELVKTVTGNISTIAVAELPMGSYFIKMITASGTTKRAKFIKN